MYMLIFVKENRAAEGFCIEFLNMVILTVVFSMSICMVICGTPFFFFKIYNRATVDKATLSRKVG